MHPLFAKVIFETANSQFPRTKDNIRHLKGHQVSVTQENCTDFNFIFVQKHCASLMTELLAKAQNFPDPCGSQQHDEEQGVRFEPRETPTDAA